MYDRNGREIRPRNGLIVKRGSMIYRSGEWVTLDADHKVVMRTERNDLCQSVSKEMTLEPLNPVT